MIIRKILNRLSPSAQDFICKCMQQRFSSNEIKKQGKPAKLMTTSDLLFHPWIQGSDSEALSLKPGKKENLMGNQSEESNLKLTLNELLRVSSDWKDVNHKIP